MRSGTEVPSYLRPVTLLLATGVAALGIAGFVSLRGDPYEPSDDALIAYSLFSGLALGGVIYAIGTILWAGRIAFWLRCIGGLAMAVPIIVPSTLSLAAPILVILLATTRCVPEAPDGTPHELTAGRSSSS
jgi:hypothetical protein